MMKEGADPNAILNKYLKPEEQGTIESWDKLPDPGMKVSNNASLNRVLYHCHTLHNVNLDNNYCSTER
jgi:hypothetical protein